MNDVTIYPTSIILGTLGGLAPNQIKDCASRGVVRYVNNPSRHLTYKIGLGGSGVWVSGVDGIGARHSGDFQSAFRSWSGDVSLTEPVEYLPE